MAQSVQRRIRDATRKSRRGTEETPLVKWLLITITGLFLLTFLLLPLLNVFVQALAKGIGTFGKSLQDPDTLAAIKLTLLVALISVPLNVVFGLAAAWC